MFAPSNSLPPYYPSYEPPSPGALERLLQSPAFLPQHGMGAFNETWKIQHGVYMNEEKESEMKASEIQKTTHALEEMKKIMTATSKRLKEESAINAKVAEGASLSEPNNLIYTDPHAYAHMMERQNVTLFTMFSFPGDEWASLKNTPFLRYLYHGSFVLDYGRLDEETFNKAMLFMSRVDKIHTLMLHDGFHLSTPLNASKAAIHHKNKTRGHPVREKKTQSSLGSVMGNGAAANAGAASSAKAGNLKKFPDEKKVIENLEIFLPIFLAKNASSLVHLELHGLTLSHWDEVISLMKRCTNLQRLYLKSCNIGDKHFADLTIIIKSSLSSLNFLQFSHCDLTSLSASLICGLIKVQSEKRNVIHWQNFLRQETTPAPSPSILLPNNLAAQGLISLDVSANQLGDKGVSLLCETLARDEWLKAVDFSNNSFGEEGLRAVINMLEENKTLLWIQIQGDRALNVNIHASIVASDGGKRKDSLSIGGPARFDKHGRRITTSQVANSTNSSSTKLLQKFDPNFEKRSKRLLMLFHAQNVEMQRFITGRNPISVSQEMEGLSRAQTKFPSPGAASIFDKYFKPLHALRDPDSFSFDLEDDDPRKKGSKKKKKVRAADDDRPATSGNPLNSPLIRGIAYQREQEAMLEAATILKKGKKSKPEPIPKAPTLPVALNFLFPQLKLLCSPDKVMTPDISLRPKPPRTDNSWNAPPKNHDDEFNFSQATLDAANSAAGKSKHQTSSTSLHSHSSGSTSSHAQSSTSSGRIDSLAEFQTSHLDFRPCLFESCVASTIDYVHQEKKAYRKKLADQREVDAMNRITALGKGRGVRRIKYNIDGEAIGEMSDDEEEEYQRSLQGGVSSSALHSPISPRSARGAAGGNVRSPPMSPSSRASSSKAFEPLVGLVKQVEQQLSHLGHAVEEQRGTALNSLQEENRKLNQELDKIEAKHREAERRKSMGLAPKSPHQQPIAQHQQQQSSLPVEAPMSPSSAAALPDGFDLAALTGALSAATQGGSSDPKLLAMLEEQFQKLHTYMDLLESQPSPSRSGSAAAAAPVQAWQEERKVDDQNQQHQQQQYIEEHEQAEARQRQLQMEEQLHYEQQLQQQQQQAASRPLVERVDFSATPPPVNVASQPTEFYPTEAQLHQEFEASSSAGQSQTDVDTPAQLSDAYPAPSALAQEVGEDIEEEIEEESGLDLSDAVSQRVGEMYGL